MSVVVLQILMLLVLIIINGVLSMAEIAVVSARKARLQQRMEEGNARARQALYLAEHPGHFLSTVQIGITLIGILTGAFGGATIADYLAIAIGRIPLLHPYAGAISLALVVVVITYFSLVLGELVPKRLALNSPERIAEGLAGFMRGLAYITKPLVHLLSGSTDLVLHLFGVKPSSEPPVTEDELIVMMAEGTEAGVFEEAEQDMVESVLQLSDRRASSLMTPRPEIVWLDPTDTCEEITRKISTSGYSRFPVADGSLDNVLGEVQSRDLLLRCLSGQPLVLTEALGPSLYVPEVMPALSVLEQLRRQSTQMALVVDEYGSVTGLVTLNDLLEAIVGDLPSAEEFAEPDAVQREDGSWLLDGMVTVEEFRDLLNLADLPGEEQGLYQTLAGFVTTTLGRLPAVADHFEWGGYRFEVVDMDGTRVDRVLASPIPRPTAEENGEPVI